MAARSNSIFPADGLPRKVCKVCHEPKPATAVAFHRATTTDGLSPDCRVCRARATRIAADRRRLAHRITQHPELLASGTLVIPTGYRLCPRCGRCAKLCPACFRVVQKAHTIRLHRYAPLERVPTQYSDLCLRCDKIEKEKI